MRFPATGRCSAQGCGGLLRMAGWALLWLAAVASAASPQEELEPFEDQPLEEPLHHPDWFKLSFLDLREDLQEAVEAGKKGLIIYYGQKYCAYCKALLEVNWGKPDIVAYTRRYFDVIGMDIHGNRPVTDLDGQEMTEREFALLEGIDFTPTLDFYDRRGELVMRLRGYYPPYQFRAALEYVVDEHYRRERFRDFLARADVGLVFGEGELNVEDFFLPPPYFLDRSRIRAERPLVVFFEQPDCYACDVLHTGPLRDAEIVRRIRRMDAVQLDIWADTPVVTPDGKRTTARQWAEALDIFYTPTLIFFDERGDEILRVDSVIQFYRLRNVLDYILSGDYLLYPNFQQWRRSRGQVRDTPSVAE